MANDMSVNGAGFVAQEYVPATTQAVAGAKDIGAMEAQQEASFQRSLQMLALQMKSNDNSNFIQGATAIAKNGKDDRDASSRAIA